MALVIDVTETYESQLNTGIQRVVRAVCLELFNQASAEAQKPILVVSTRTDREAANILPFESLVLNQTSDSPVPNVMNAKSYVALAKLWNLIDKTRLSSFLKLPLIQTFAEASVRKIQRNLIQSQPPAPKYKFGTGDTLLLADAFWGSNEGLLLAKKAKKMGANVALLLNDIFPISHPELCEKKNVIRFSKLCSEALELADFVMYPSHSTKIEIDNYFGKILEKKPNRKISYGHDGIAARLNLSPEVEPLRMKNSICMVGTIEPRKNYGIVFDWFTSKERFTTKLTFIGKPGWLTSDLQSKFRLEASTNDNFTWHESASDELLSHELRRHEIGVMASYAEGFGLPVVEMNEAGLKLVLSDIPIFKEVAGASAKYFNPESLEDLDNAIKLARSDEAVQRITHVSWAETASQIRSFIEAQSH